MNKAAMDLKAGRGNPVEHLGKIVYYGAIQNLIFTSLQQGLAFMGVNPISKEMSEDDEKDIFNALNSMFNSILSGFGLYGFIISTLKDSARRLMYELDRQKEGKKTDYFNVFLELADFSPPIGSKFKDVYKGLKGYGYKSILFNKDYKNPDGSFNFNKFSDLVVKDLKQGNADRLEPDARVFTGATNLPFDRLVQKIENLSNALNDQNTYIQRIATGLGWPGYQVGIETPYEKKQKQEKKSNIVKPYRQPKATKPKQRLPKRR